MNDEEAIVVLEQEVAKLRDESYSNLASRTSAGSLVHARTGPGGTTYQVEVQCFWDDRPGGNVRVIASIDDGGWRALLPLNRDFIKAPDGSFVGE